MIRWHNEKLSLSRHENMMSYKLSRIYVDKMSYKLSTKFPTNKIAKSNFSLLRWENCDEQTLSQDVFQIWKQQVSSKITFTFLFNSFVFCFLFDIFSSAWKWFSWSSTSEVIVIVKYVQTHRIPLIAMGKDSKSRFISVLKMSFQFFLRILLKVKPLLKGWRTCRRDSHWPPERRVLALFVKSFTHCQLSPTLHCQIRVGNQSSRFFTLRSALLIGVPCRTDICKNKCFTI